MGAAVTQGLSQIATQVIMMHLCTGGIYIILILGAPYKKVFGLFSIFLEVLRARSPSHLNKHVKLHPGTYFHLLNHPQGLL